MLTFHGSENRLAKFGNFCKHILVTQCECVNISNSIQFFNATVAYEEMHIHNYTTRMF